VSTRNRTFWASVTVLAAAVLGMTAIVVATQPVSLVEECMEAGDRLIQKYDLGPEDGLTTTNERRGLCEAAVVNGELTSKADIERDERLAESILTGLKGMNV
jgi:hypothetical protein